MQRGFTLLETMITVAIVAMIVVAGGAFAQGFRPYAASSAVTRMAALLVTARSLAAASGNGATLTLVPSGDETTVTLYAGRPDGGAFGTVVTTDTLAATITSAGVAGSTVTLFIDSAGTGTASAWVPSQGVLAAEPACPGPLDLTFSVSGGHSVHALSCTDMILR
jgi:prepilin-type N-terminal cleavage/methylation domain-containing protein